MTSGIKHAVITGISVGGANMIVSPVSGCRILLLSYLVVGGDTAAAFYWSSGVGTPLSGTIYLAAGSGVFASSGSADLPLLKTEIAEQLNLHLPASLATVTLEGHITYTLRP